MITKWINLNCKLLKIPTPRLVFADASTFPTNTTRACITGDLADIKSVEMRLSKSYFNNDTPFFLAAVTIAHELRHFWQMLNIERPPYFKSNNVTIKEYNEQDLELDAWAWASYIMQREYGVYPTFDFLGEEYTQKVLSLADAIKDTI